MKRLTVTYGDVVVYDADVSEYKFEETPSSVTVIGKTQPAPRRPNGNLSGLFNGLAAAAKQSQLAAEATPIDLAETGE